MRAWALCLLVLVTQVCEECMAMTMTIQFLVFLVKTLPVSPGLQKKMWCIMAVSFNEGDMAPHHVTLPLCICRIMIQLG